MLKRTLVVAATVVTCVGAADTAASQDAIHPSIAQTAAAQSAAERAPAPQAPTRQSGDPANIRLDLTISVTDLRGAALVPAKTATLHVVDRDHARIRVGETATSTPAPANLVMPPTPVLNIDANPHVTGSGRIRVNLSFEYRPKADVDKGEPLHVNERVSAVLDDGKPLVISQTTDPSADRIVKVELKATILR
jgi:hypothetical protein